MSLPTNTKKLIDSLADNGWSFQCVHSADTGGAPYVSIEGRKNGSEVHVTWHTRDSGNYRLFTCMMSDGKSRVRDATLTAVMYWTENA